MKRLFASFITFSMILISCAVRPPSPTSTPTATSVPDLFDTPWEDRSLFKSGLVVSEQSVLNELLNASVYHIEFRIAEDIYHVDGTEEVRYTNAEDVALNQVQLRLFPNILGGEMTVSNVTVDDQSVTPKLELRNSLLIIPLPASIKPGQSVVLRMDFSTTVPQSVELNYGVLAYFDGVLTIAHAYPMIAVYDDEGWNAEIPPQDGDVTYVDTAFYIVKITAPEGLTLVTSGSEISRSEAGQTQTLHVASGPARDFYLAASPLYEETSQTFGEVTIKSYAPSGLKDGAKMALDVAARAIEVFTRHYAP